MTTGSSGSIARVRASRRAFTLVELLVVISIIALLIAILLPSLQKAKMQAEMVVCLANLKSMGTATMTYASEYDGRLPGPLHPAVYRMLLADTNTVKAKGPGPFAALSDYAKERQLLWKLRPIMQERGGGVGGATDKVSVCPTMEKIVPLSQFEQYAIESNKSTFRPLHYCINNWQSVAVDGPGGAQDPYGIIPHGTKPANYFGNSYWDSNATEYNTPPVSISQIKRAADEWAIAEAWYRPNLVGNRLAKFGVPTQEGTFQAGWTGMALPNFAVHMRKNHHGYHYYLDSQASQRDIDSRRVRTTRSDGKTDTFFFDGHAAGVSSKSITQGALQLFYGFPGTVNPPIPLDPARFAWD